MAQVLSETQIYAAARAAGFSPSESVIATAIAMAESGGNPAATHHNTNGSTDYGLWQINSVHSDLLSGGAKWQDPATNARMARSVYLSQGWHAWSTYNSGAYKKETNPHMAATLKNSHDSVPVSTGDGGGIGGFLGGLGNDLLGGPTAGLPKQDQPNVGGDLAGLGSGAVKLGSGVLGSLVPSGLAAVFTVEFWERFGWGLLGFILALIGIGFMIESNKTARSLTEMAVAA